MSLHGPRYCDQFGHDIQTCNQLCISRVLAVDFITYFYFTVMLEVTTSVNEMVKDGKLTRGLLASSVTLLMQNCL